MIIIITMILAIPDYLPLSLREYVGHFLNIFNISKHPLSLKKDDKLLGYSCRSLFDTTMSCYFQKHPNLKVLTTPLHHTSFRNIIEKYVKPENIHILDVDDNYQKIISYPDEETHLCIITHMFGQDLDTTILQKYKEQYPTCVFIEDRVQGGVFSQIYSQPFFDMAFYSTGMDKKPCGLGGGFICFKESNDTVQYVHDQIMNYPQESLWNRSLFLSKKIPTYLLYNCRWFIMLSLKLLQLFRINLHTFSKGYRKNNPGFDHENYNKRPSNATICSINDSFKGVKQIELNYDQKSTLFLNLFPSDLRQKYFPWYRGEPLLTVYNTISIMDSDERTKLIDELTNRYITVMENPTYKTFSSNEFNQSLVYLPSLANMTFDEMSQLAEIIINL